MAATALAAEDSRPHRLVSWLLLAALLVLRLPFLGGVLFVSPAASAWVAPVYEVATYVLTAALIWWERERLAEFHLDRLAVAVVILFKPVETLILTWWGLPSRPLALPNWPSLIIWATALALLAALWPARRKLPGRVSASLRWLGVGIGAGVAAALALGYPMSLQIPASEVTYRVHLLSLLALAPGQFAYQLGYAAVAEEPLFRGFLWGYLRRLGWKEVWIWLVQAGLFAVGHIYYWGNSPISLWVIVPTCALVFGALVWRSRTISASMGAHAAANTFGHTVGYVIASWRL